MTGRIRAGEALFGVSLRDEAQALHNATSNQVSSVRQCVYAMV